MMMSERIGSGDTDSQRTETFSGNPDAHADSGNTLGLPEQALAERHAIRPSSFFHTNNVSGDPDAHADDVRER